MGKIKSGVVIGALLAAGLATAGMPAPMTSAQVFDFCDSQTIAEAEAKGNKLGWQRMTDSELQVWRTGFLSYNGGLVEVLGWRRGGSEGDDLLSFWIARGPSNHRVCAYSIARPASLLDDLSEHFGIPTSLNKYKFGATAIWKLGQREVSFSQIGSSAVLYIADQD
jgi:hypothetical protein